MAGRSAVTIGLVACAAVVGVVLALPDVTTAPRSFALVIEGRPEARSSGPADDTPPTVACRRTSVTSLRHPPRAYLLRVPCAIHDASRSDLGYRVAVSAYGRFLASRVGATRAGNVTAVLRLQVPANVRTLRIAIRAVDRSGNERVTFRVARLPR